MNMKKAALALGGLIIGVLVVRSATQPKLEHFTPSEFGVWWLLMNPVQLKRLDKFRELMGSPVFISKAEGALGRKMGDVHSSQHNVDKWGMVNATDVFPTLPADNEKGWKYIETEAERQFVFEKAKEAGFTGIGLYTDTFPANMLHVDSRPDRTPEDRALWSRVNGQYLSIEAVV